MQLTVIYRMHYRGYFKRVKTEMFRLRQRERQRDRFHFSQRETETGRVQFRMDNQTVRSELRM